VTISVQASVLSHCRIESNRINKMMLSANEQKAEVLGSYFSGVFTKENNIPYDTRNVINADETLSQLNCQFGQ